MQVQHETKLRKRSQTVVKVAVEAYLRTDLLCGSPECSSCLVKTLGLPPQSSHYLVPDSQALEDYLDVFELPDFTGFIILTSVLCKVAVQLNGHLLGKALLHCSLRKAHDKQQGGRVKPGCKLSYRTHN